MEYITVLHYYYSNPDCLCDTCKLPQVCDCHIHPPEYKRSFSLCSELLLLGLQSPMSLSLIFVA